MYLLLRQRRDTWHHLAIIQVGEVGHLATASFGFTAAVPIPIFAEVASVDSASLVMELRLAFGQWHPGRCSKLIAS